MNKTLAILIAGLFAAAAHAQTPTAEKAAVTNSKPQARAEAKVASKPAGQVKTGAGGDIKRMLLDRDTYYSSTGGHGACRGCGEVTAIHLFNSLSQLIGGGQRAAQPVDEGERGRIPVYRRTENYQIRPLRVVVRAGVFYYRHLYGGKVHKAYAD